MIVFTDCGTASLWFSSPVLHSKEKLHYLILRSTRLMTHFSLFFCFTLKAPLWHCHVSFLPFQVTITASPHPRTPLALRVRGYLHLERCRLNSSTRVSRWRSCCWCATLPGRANMLLGNHIKWPWHDTCHLTLISWLSRYEEKASFQFGHTLKRQRLPLVLRAYIKRYWAEICWSVCL